MKKEIPTPIIVVIGVVVLGLAVLLLSKAGGNGGPTASPEETKNMVEFRDHNAEVTGGKINEQTGETIQPSDERTDEAKDRESRK